MKKNIAIFGLGSMGFGIAKSCIDNGHKVWGFDISRRTINKFKKIGGVIDTFDKIAENLDMVFLVVLNAKQVKSIFTKDPGILKILPKEKLVINCVTNSPNDAENFYNLCKKNNIQYLDSPISGGAKKAMHSKITIMASGSEKSFKKANEVFKDISEKVYNLGLKPGSGSAMKAVNQLLAGVHIAAMAEALNFAKAQDIDIKQCVEIISKSAGNSWMFQNRSQNIISNDFSPKSALDIWPKDLGIVDKIARELNLHAPIVKTALKEYKLASKNGLGSLDDSILIKHYFNKNKTI